MKQIYTTIAVTAMMVCVIMIAGCTETPSVPVVNVTEQQEVAAIVAQDDAQYVNQTPEPTVVPTVVETPYPVTVVEVAVPLVAPTPNPNVYVDPDHCPINTVNYYGTCIAGVKVVYNPPTNAGGAIIDSPNE